MVLSCEHGGNRVPAAYRSLFRGAAALLASHRGWDVGALPLARLLARDLGAPLCAATVSRLVVDLNRSPGHPRIFSELTRRLPESERAALVARHYTPHRDEVLVRRAQRGGRTLHLAIHSFTPELDGKVRAAEVGLLYDPARPGERELCLGLKRALGGVVHVRMNYPYQGTSDGLTTYLRRLYPDDAYAGVEIEINQRISADPSQRRRLAALLGPALRAVIG